MCVQYRGGAQYRGGYHEYHRGISWVPWGCSIPWGISWGLRGVFSTVGDRSFVFWVPLRYWTPPQYSWYLLTCIMISLRYSTNKKLYAPHGTEHLPQYSWYPPHASWYWTSPRYSRYLPTVLMISIYSRYWTPSMALGIPTVLNTHYTGWFLGISKSQSPPVTVFFATVDMLFNFV